MDTGQTHFRNGEDVCRFMADQSDGVCLLAFSRGKDSLASYFQLRRFFKRVVIYHCAPVPGLQFIERDLDRWENYFQQPIVRLIHPQFFRMVQNGIFQPPERNEALDALYGKLGSFEALDLQERVKRDHLLDLDNTYTAVGLRALDNLRRRTHCKRNGQVIHSKKMFYPVWDWTKDRLISEIVNHKAKLPVDYQMWAGSMDGVIGQWTVPLARRFPEDWERLKFWFPLADAEHFRFAMMRV
jgi:hypothetical protein